VLEHLAEGVAGPLESGQPLGRDAQQQLLSLLPAGKAQLDPGQGQPDLPG
jgi:hypothetical protein